VPAIRLGDVTVTRVVEIDRSSNPIERLLPASTPAALAAERRWLAPHWLDPVTGEHYSHIQTYVVRTPRHTVLVDTGVGNDKRREGWPLWNLRRGSYLDDLAATGVTPDQVDYVVCTHMHVDHVGWNTRRAGERWVPTFPRATYVFVGEEWEFWRRESAAGAEPSGCIDDSVWPIVASGQALLVPSDHAVTPELRFEPSPGHTPGHACLRLSTPAGTAIFSGDLMHRAVQVARPEWSSCFCTDPARSRATREAFVEAHADSGALILAAHFPHSGRIVRADRGFRFERADVADGEAGA
jgi:glyoxylase-like metal-dependent hydrolase (beta-lactamase superfamily II)